MKTRSGLFWKHWFDDEAGQTMVEYAIVAALIAVVAMIAVEALGSGISGVFERITDEITNI